MTVMEMERSRYVWGMFREDINRIADGLHMVRQGGMRWLLEVWLE